MTDCPSTIHKANDDPWPMLPATVPGTFDGSHINGRAPSRITYCIRCAQALRSFGAFTPDNPDDLEENT